MLGLISSTPEGAEVLDDYHWEATLSPLGLPIGICIPEDIDKFISVSIRLFQQVSCLYRAVASDVGNCRPRTQGKYAIATHS